MKIVASSSINGDATKIKEHIDKLTYDINFIQDYISSLPQMWSGDDEKKFVSKYNDEVLPVLHEYEKTFNEYYTFLAKVYGIFETLEEEYDKAINTE